MTDKVCIITTVHRSFDIRIFHKEAKSLIKAGYDVTLIAQHDKNEMVDGIKIIALPKPKNRLFRIFLSGWKAFNLALKQNADIFHFHDPEFIFFGILLRFSGNKVIYDVHEDYPKQILSKRWIGNRFIRVIMSFLMNCSEKFSALFFTKIIVVTDSIYQRFPKNKTILLRNFPLLKIIDDANPLNFKKDIPIIIYAGGLTYDRGIKEIVQAMKYVGDKAELWLLGKWMNLQFQEDCQKLKGWQYTKYLGFKEIEEVYKIMKISDIGIFVARPIDRYKIGLATKIFEYMACSIPVILSDFPYRRKLFGECALFVNPLDSESIAKQILFLLANKKEAEVLAKKGRKMVRDYYNWETESRKLIELYDLLIKNK